MTDLAGVHSADEIAQKQQPNAGHRDFKKLFHDFSASPVGGEGRFCRLFL